MCLRHATYLFSQVTYKKKQTFLFLFFVMQCLHMMTNKFQTSNSKYLVALCYDIPAAGRGPGCLSAPVCTCQSDHRQGSCIKGRGSRGGWVRGRGGGLPHLQDPRRSWTHVNIFLSFQNSPSLVIGVSVCVGRVMKEKHLCRSLFFCVSSHTSKKQAKWVLLPDEKASCCCKWIGEIAWVPGFWCDPTPAAFCVSPQLQEWNKRRHKVAVGEEVRSGFKLPAWQPSDCSSCRAQGRVYYKPSEQFYFVAVHRHHESVCGVSTRSKTTETGKDKTHSVLSLCDYTGHSRIREHFTSRH